MAVWNWDGAKLKRDLLIKEWSQAELAKRAKVSESSVTRMLTGKGCHVRIARKIAHALGRPLAEYAKQDEPEPETVENRRVCA